MAVIPEESKQTDISLDRTTTDIYRKDTNTDQYVSFTSYEPWLEPCSIALLAFAITTLCFRNKYQCSKLSCIGMVFLDLVRLTSLNVSCVVTLGQDHPTIKAFFTRSLQLPKKTKIY